MLEPSDLIHLSYTPDLTRAGIRYALRSLPYTYDRMGGAGIQRLRRIVSGIAVEQAFRRYLEAQHLPFHTLGATPYTDPDRYDLSLAGRRCDLKSFQLFNHRQVQAAHHRPDYLLKAAALVPVDQAETRTGHEKNLYVFAFMTAQATDSQVDLIHLLPAHWARPPEQGTIGRPVFKYEGPGTPELEAGGQDDSGEFKTLHLALPAGRRIETQVDYRSLNYLRTTALPSGRLGVHSPALKETHVAAPEAWHNIWVDGLRVILAGWLHREEFLSRAHRLPAGSRVLQYARTRTDNLAVSVAELRPLTQLFEQIKG